MASDLSGTDNDGLARLKIIKAKAKQVGLDAALHHAPKIEHYAKMDIPNIFGDKWAKAFRSKRERLLDNYGSKFASLIIFSLREYTYACHKAAAFMSEVVVLDDERYEETRKLTTPQGYADSEGWANTLFDSLSDVRRPVELLQDTSFQQPICPQDVLETMAILWFFDAAHIHDNGDDGVMDFLFEAADALNLANGLYMWNCAEEVQMEELKAAGSKRAKSLNDARHRKTYEAKSKVIRDWEEDPARFASAEKAGLHYTYWLAKNGAMYEHRTVTGWIRAHAKEIGVRFR